MGDRPFFMPKVITHTPHRVVVRWSSDEPQPDPVLVEDALRVPGVTQPQPNALAFPRSTWGLPVVAALLGDTPAPVELDVHADPKLLEGLYPHQRQAVEFLLQNDGGLLGDQMGLGKTRAAAVAAWTWHEEHPRKPPVLIIAPRYTRETWKRELEALGVLGNGFWAVEGTDPSSQPRNYDADWWFCHYEILTSWVPVFTVNRRGRPAGVILDEAHWVRNARSRRGAAAQLVGHLSGRVIALTGTPLANRPSDLWALLTVLDGHRSWGHALDFRQRYCGASHSGYGWVDGQPTHVEEFHQRLQTRYLRRTIDEVGIELPSITRSPVYVDLTEPEIAQQREELESVFAGASLEDVFTLVTSGKAGSQAFEALHNLRVRTSAAKVGTTVDYVSSLAQQGEQVVVFTWQRKTAERIAKALAKVCPTTALHGGQPQAAREALVYRFQRGKIDKFQVLVATMDALKEGVTLHAARHVVLHDLSWNPGDVLQAEARVYRIGQARPVTSTWVLARDSFDTLLAQALLRKGGLQSTMLAYTDTETVLQEVEFAGGLTTSLEAEGARLLEWWRAREAS